MEFKLEEDSKAKIELAHILALPRYDPSKPVGLWRRADKLGQLEAIVAIIHPYSQEETVNGFPFIWRGSCHKDASNFQKRLLQLVKKHDQISLSHLMMCQPFISRMKLAATHISDEINMVLKHLSSSKRETRMLFEESSYPRLTEGKSQTQGPTSEAGQHETMVSGLLFGLL